MNIGKEENDKNSGLKNHNTSKNVEGSIITDGITRDETYDNLVIGFFSLKGRANRLEYIKIESMIFLFLIINYVYFIPITPEKYTIGFIITSWIMTLATIPITVRRLHDSNLSGWYYLVSMVPNVLLLWGTSAPPSMYSTLTVVSAGFGIYFLYLVLRRGDLCANNYGMPNPPKKYGSKTINLIFVLLFIFILVSGILATSFY